MQSAVQAQKRRPLTASQHPGLVLKTTSPGLFVWYFIFYSLFSCFLYISDASKLEYLCRAPDWAKPSLPHGKDLLPESCLSASGECGWSEAARVEMMGVGVILQNKLCASRFPLGLGNMRTAGIKSKSLDHRELSRCKHVIQNWKTVLQERQMHSSCAWSGWVMLFLCPGCLSNSSYQDGISSRFTSRSMSCLLTLN